MREIKIRYYLQREETLTHKKVIISVDYLLSEIEKSHDFINTLIASLRQVGQPDYKVIAKCEYTGLSDKNGIEIYENDFIKIPGYDFTYEVRYNLERGGFWLWNIQLNDWSRDLYRANHWGVTGNRFENPELLNKDGK